MTSGSALIKSIRRTLMCDSLKHMSSVLGRGLCAEFVQLQWILDFLILLFYHLLLDCVFYMAKGNNAFVHFFPQFSHLYSKWAVTECFSPYFFRPFSTKKVSHWGAVLCHGSHVVLSGFQAHTVLLERRDAPLLQASWDEEGNPTAGFVGSL